MKHIHTLCFVLLAGILAFICSCKNQPADKKASGKKQPEITEIASGLGDVYGLDFDKDGNLFAVGSDDRGAVLWKILPGGKKEIYARVKDPVDVLWLSGMSSHSKYLTQMAIDDKGNAWIASSLYGAGFIISADTRKMIKLYLNMDYSLVEDSEPDPYGVAWDGIQKRILLVTNGPADQYGIEQIHHIHSIHFNSLTNDYEGLYTGSNDSIYFTGNDGVKIPFMGRGLMTSEHFPVLFIGENCVYKVSDDGDFSKIGDKLEAESLWSGVSDQKGNMYLTANDKDYEPGKGNSEGCIYRLTPEGKYKILTKEIKEPLGIAINEGSIYISDRSKGRIVKMKLD
jgi:hypothetical protein